MRAIPERASSFKRASAAGDAAASRFLRRTNSEASPAIHVKAGSRPTLPLGFRSA
jgi:hypothetical protein